MLGEEQLSAKPLMSRVWAMPNADTFSVPPIGAFVQRYLRDSKCSIDPCARNKTWATYTNDINPATRAAYHMDAGEFLSMLCRCDVECDLLIFDPPYSPRQISECHKAAGIKVGMAETQNSALYKRLRDSANELVKPDGVVLSFGWNSAGMGAKRGYEIEEIMLVAHGGAHNDTICMAERKVTLC